MNIAVIVHSNRLTRRDQHRLLTRLEECHVRVYRTRFAGHAEQLARNAVRGGADTIVVVGGDGTVHQAYRGIGSAPVRLAVIPRGTANDLASTLGLPQDIDSACDAIIAGQTRSVDVMYINTIPCLTVAAVGLPVHAVRRTQGWLRKGPLAGLLRRVPGSVYVVGLIATLLRDHWPAIPARIQTDDSCVELRLSSLVVGKLPIFGRYFRPLPQAQPDDGLVHCCWFDSAAPPWARLRSLWRSARGVHAGDVYVSTRSHRTVMLTLDKPAGLLVDGELYEPVRQVNVMVLPQALPIIVTYGGAQLEEDAYMFATAEVRQTQPDVDLERNPGGITPPQAA